MLLLFKTFKKNSNSSYTFLNKIYKKWGNKKDCAREVNWIIKDNTKRGGD